MLTETLIAILLYDVLVEHITQSSLATFGLINEFIYTT